MFTHVAQAPEGGFEVRKDNVVGKHPAEVSIVTKSGSISWLRR